MKDTLFKAKRKDNGEWVEGHLSYNFFADTATILVIPKSTEQEIADFESYKKSGDISVASFFETFKDKINKIIEYEIIPETIEECNCELTKEDK